MRRAAIIAMILLPAIMFAGCARASDDRNATGTATLNRLAATIPGVTVVEASYAVHGAGAQTPYLTLGLSTASTDSATVDGVLRQAVQVVADTLAAEHEDQAYVKVWVRDGTATESSSATAGLDKFATAKDLQDWLAQHPR